MYKFVEKNLSQKLRNQLLGSRKSGFTLIELLVSLGIFILFLGVVSTSYISILRTQRQANGVRKMYSEVRTFMDTLSTDMRLGTLDYDCYENLGAEKCPTGIAGVATISSEGTSTYLALVNKANTQKTVYWFDETAHNVKIKKFILSANAWTVAPEYNTGVVDDNDGFQPMFGNDVKIDYLTFALYPAVNPYSQDHYNENQYQFQPKVTVYLTASNNGNTVTPFTLNFQTTLSSRVYSRKAL